MLRVLERASKGELHVDLYKFIVLLLVTYFLWHEFANKPVG